MQRTAQCQCGSLRAVVTGQPQIVNLCHCRACQRRTGSVFSVGAYFNKAQVRCAGSSKVHTRRSESGFEVRRHFCPECGSSVYWELERAPELCGIAVGCFADPDFSAPSFSMWEESRHPWMGLPSDIEHCSQGLSATAATRRHRLRTQSKLHMRQRIGHGLFREPEHALERTVHLQDQEHGATD